MSVASEYLKLRSKKQQETAAQLQKESQDDQQRLTGGYYQLPQTDVSDEERSKRITQLETSVTEKKTALTDREAAMQDEQALLSLLQNRVNRLASSYRAAPTQTAASAYEKACANYAQAQQKARNNYLDYLAQFDAYETDYQAYSEAVAEQKARARQVQAWRGTIRDAQAVQADIDQVDAQISALQSKQRSQQPIVGKVLQWAGLTEVEESGELKALERKRALLQEEYDWSRYFQYSDLLGAEDFAQKSKYVSTANGYERTAADIAMGNYSDEKSGWDDPLYEYINGNEEAGAYLSNKAAASYGSDNALGAAYGRTAQSQTQSQQMTDEEVAVFNYLYATQGKEAAHTYYEYLQSDLNYRQRKAEEAYWTEYASESPGAASVFSVAISPMKGLSYVGQLGDYLEDGELTSDAAYNQYSYVSSAIRNQVASQWGPVGSFAYQTGMSMADFLTNTLVSGGNAKLAMAIMGSGTAADTTLAAKDRGLNDDQAFALGTVAGLAEALTEKYSLEALLDATSLGTSAAGYIAKNMLAEGSEESASSLINMFADILISKDKSEWSQSIAAYKAQGMTEEKAFCRAVADQAASIGLDMLGGAISGGVMAGGGVALNGIGAALNKTQKTQNAQTAPSATFQEDIQKQVDAKLGEEKAAQTATEGAVRLADMQVDAPQELWDQAQRLAAATGRNIVLFSGDANVNGYFQRSTGEIYVNINAAEPLAQIFSHELTHSVELAEVYAELSRVVLSRIEESGQNLDQVRKAKADAYSRNGVKLGTQQEVDAEIVAEYVQKQLLTDEQSIVSLVRQNRSIAGRIRAWLDRIIAKLGSKGAQERAFLERARALYAQALQQTQSSFTQETASADGSQSVASDKTYANESDPEVAEGMRQVEEAYVRGEISDAVYDQLMDAYERWQEEQRTAGERKYSYAGEAAKTANLFALMDALKMVQQNVDSEQIRNETGWFKGMDGKWRYEIDDSGMAIKESLSNYLKLGDLIEHKDLFAAYPEMVDIDVTFQNLGKGIYGQYNRTFDSIDLDRSLMKYPEALKNVLVHELQHAIQNREGFTHGSSVESWERKRKAGFDSRRSADIRKAQETEQELRRIKEEDPEFYQDMMELDAMSPDVPRGKVNWDTLQQITGDPPEWQAFDARRDALEEQYGDTKVWDFMDLLYQREKAAKNPGRSATDLYFDTAGEIEARDVENRRNLDAEGRKKRPPRLGNEDTVFAEGTGDRAGKNTTREGGVKYSIRDSFYEEFDSWDKKDTNKTFVVGTTSEALLSVGMKDQNIVLRSGTVLQKVNKHQEMTFDTFKGIPELLEHPVIVQFSDAVDAKTQKPKYDSRITVLGELYAEGKPVLVSLELMPTNQKKTVVLDFAVVTSAYSKNALQQYLNENSILYIDPDKKRTNRWLSLNRLQLPLGEDRYGSIRRIAYIGNKVKVENSRNMTAMEKALRDAGAIDKFGNTKKEGNLKKGTSQVPDANTPSRDAQNELASVPKKNVPQQRNDVKKQFSFAEERNSKEDVASDLRAILKRGGSAAELRQYVQQLEQSGGKTERKTGLTEQNRSEAERIVRAAQKQGLAVEEYLRRNWEHYDQDGQWNGAARRALELEQKATGAGAEKNTTREGGAIQYSLREFEDGTRFVDVEMDAQAFDGMTVAEMNKAVKSILMERFAGKVIGLDNRAFVNGDSVNEYLHPSKSIDIDTRKAKLTAAGELDNLLDAGTALPNKADGEDGHVHPDAIDFSYYKSIFKVGKEYFEGIVNIKNIKRGKLLKDVTKIRNITKDIVSSYGESPKSNFLRDVSMDSISKRIKNVKEKFSDRDSDGHQISLEQKAGRKYSISDDEADAAAEEKADIRSTLPRKAQDYLKRTERTLLWELGDALSVPKLARRDYLQPIIQELSDAYLQEGTIPSDKLQLLFERAYAEGVIVDAEFFNEYKHIKDHLRTLSVTISKRDQGDIADFKQFKKRAFGTLRIVNEGGLPVDTAYRELQEMAPELFPESITHPADQLVRMYDAARSIQVTEKSVQDYYGKYEPEYRKGARAAFDEAVARALPELKTVKRYADDRVATDTEKAPATAEEAMEAYKQLKAARRTYERVAAKNLLTKHDEVQLGRLLRGEIGLEHLDPKTDNVDGITAVFEAKQEYEKLCKLLGEYKQHLRGQMRKLADKYLETANTWKDKKAGVLYARETMRRNIQDIVPDAALARQINEEFFEPVHRSEAESNRFRTRYRDRVRALGLSTKAAKGNLVSEAHAVQLLGEAEDNIRMLENFRGRIKNRDGKNLSEWQAVIDKLWAENPNLDQAKIRNAVQIFRKIYDELFQQMNKVRVANGYEPVNYRNGYFPHFQPGDSDSILAQFGRALGIDTQVNALPTTINGLTHTFKPGIQWFGNAQERLGFNTAYDAVEGFDKYIEGVASVIYHTENIQKLRALASQIRYRTSEKGIQDQVDAIYADNRYSEDEKQVMINEIYAHGKFALSNFVTELDEYTNLLANKKSKYDRTVEAMMGRGVYTFLKAWEARVGANMIAGNLTSALTNFIPLTQAGAQMDKLSLLKGMWGTLQSYRKDDGIVGMSTFLTNRRGSDPLVQNWAQKASGVLSTPMEVIDAFTADSIVRGAYYQNLKQGMSETEAMNQADIFASNVMADRSKGAMPTLMQASNPLFKAFTQFQLEVNNQFSEVFKDLPRGFKEKGLKALAWVLLQYFLGAFLYNELYEKLIGRRPALDPIGVLCDAVTDTVELGIGEAGANLAVNLLEQLPFSAGLSLIGVEIDGGRIPASAAVPDLTALWDAATTEGWSAEKRWKEVQDELNKLAYVVPPFGGNQVSKLWKGVKSYIQGGSYSVDAEGNKTLQYPVYKDEPQDAFWSLVKAAFLGKSSLDTAQDWVRSGFDGLNAKQTAVYNDMLEAGVTGREAFALLQQLQGAQDAEQRELLRNSEVSGDGKAIVYYGLMATDKELELMDSLADLGADAWAVTDTLMQMRDANALKGSAATNAKYAAIKKAALTDEEKAVLIGSIMGAELFTESGGISQYGKFQYAVQNGMSVNEYISYRSTGASIDDYLEMRDAGASIEDAMETGIALEELRNNVESPSTVQKWRTVIDSTDDEQVQMISLSIVMTQSQHRKLRTAYSFGISPEVYVEVNESLSKYDADGNGRYTQAEVTQAIDALRVLNSTKAALWQIVTGASSAKNNPYSTDVGQKVLDALAAAKEQDAQTGLTFEEEIRRQLMGG